LKKMRRTLLAQAATGLAFVFCRSDAQSYPVGLFTSPPRMKTSL
jgi:hypothetical protein